MTTLSEQIAAARLPERTHPVCLRGDLVAEVERLDRQLAAVKAADEDSLASDGGRGQAEQIQALQEQMRASTVELTLRALPRGRWHELIAEHPTRDGNQRDTTWGVNEVTFFPALCRECLTTPVSDADWTGLLAAMSDGQWDRLTTVAWNLNRGDVDVPFSRAASETLRTSATA